jgi:hypothetical protein
MDRRLFYLSPRSDQMQERQQMSKNLEIVRHAAARVIQRHLRNARIRKNLAKKKIVSSAHRASPN